MTRTQLRLAVVAGVALAAGCYEYKVPTLTGTADPILTASWMTGAIPSGSYTALTLQAAGGRIIGSGSESRLCCWHDTLSVSGQYEYEDMALLLSLTITYGTGPTATYAGKAVGTDSLVGIWTSTSAGASFPRTFFRMATSCSSRQWGLGPRADSASG